MRQRCLAVEDRAHRPYRPIFLVLRISGENISFQYIKVMFDTAPVPSKITLASQCFLLEAFFLRLREHLKNRRRFGSPPKRLLFDELLRATRTRALQACLDIFFFTFPRLGSSHDTRLGPTKTSKIYTTST
jgi:hypothetical protein